MLYADVLVLSPSWTTYKPQASLARHNAVVINTKIEDEWRLTPEAVDQVSALVCRDAFLRIDWANPSLYFRF